MATKSKSSGKRELINTGADKRFVRRGEKGQFKGATTSAVRFDLTGGSTRTPNTKPGQGDRGDRKR